MLRPSGSGESTVNNTILATHAAAQEYELESPNVDFEGGYFYQADTIEDLASQIVNRYGLGRVQTGAYIAALNASQE